MKFIVALLLLSAIACAEEEASPTPPSTASVKEVLKPDEAAAVAKASRRFEDFMRFWREGGTDYHREGIIAASLWMRGRRQIGSAEELNDATHYFDRWRVEKKLLVPKISYYVQEYHWNKDHTEVDVVINGKPFRVGIPNREMPLFWVE